MVRHRRGPGHRAGVDGSRPRRRRRRRRHRAPTGRPRRPRRRGTATPSRWRCSTCATGCRARRRSPRRRTSGPPRRRREQRRLRHRRHHRGAGEQDVRDVARHQRARCACGSARRRWRTCATRARAHRADLDRRGRRHDARVRGVQRQQVGAGGVQRGDGRRGASVRGAGHDRRARRLRHRLGRFQHALRRAPGGVRPAAHGRVRHARRAVGARGRRRPAHRRPAGRRRRRDPRPRRRPTTGPLRLLVGDDAPTFVALALAARRDDYGRDLRFEWPAPEVGADPVQ